MLALRSGDNSQFKIVLSQRIGGINDKQIRKRLRFGSKTHQSIHCYAIASLIS